VSARADQTAARLQTLSPRERARLEGILARLASPFESERAAAALLASAFVARHDLTWSHLTMLLQPVPEAAPQPQASYGRTGDTGRYRPARADAHGQALNVVA
jgi:hypothetical protein